MNNIWQQLQLTTVLQNREFSANLINKKLTVFAQIQLEVHQKKAVFSSMVETSKISEVMECYHITGTFDILLKVCVKDIEEYTALISNKLFNLPHVGTMQSVFVLNEAKKRIRI